MEKVVPSQAREYLAAKFAGISNIDVASVRQEVGYLAGFVELYDAVPGELIRLHPNDFTRLVGAIAAMRYGIKKFQNGDPGECLIPVARSIPVVLSLLIKLNDQATSTLHDLTFIRDDFLRESIGLDLAAISTALHSGEWKGATILAGSCCEALLLYALQQSELKTPGCISRAITSYSGKKKLNPNDLIDKSWDLFSYTEVAFDLNLILKITKIELEPARDYRNLIHPAKSAREKVRFDRGTALVGAGALDHVVRDLKNSLV